MYEKDFLLNPYHTRSSCNIDKDGDWEIEMCIVCFSYELSCIYVSPILVNLKKKLSQKKGSAALFLRIISLFLFT